MAQAGAARGPGEVGQRSDVPTMAFRDLHHSATNQAETLTKPRRLPTIPGYDIRAEIGQGGMGVVYEARHISLNRRVALKSLVANGPTKPEEFVRFRTEEETLARLHHPGIVQIFDVGMHEGLPFFTMELLEGGSLADRLHGQPMAAPEAARLVEQLARAIAAAHLEGIVHRDLKPANVLMAGTTDYGQPKITDFGLAKWLDRDHGLTQTGMVAGTPNYMAPEQAAGVSRNLGVAVDIYGLGAILYVALTGRPPFQGDNALAVLDQVRTVEPIPPSRLLTGIPRDLETICLKCLEKDPARRYASAAMLAADLVRFLGREPIHARPISRLERGLRWCRRKPIVAGLLAAVILLVVLALGGTSWGYLQAVAERDRAEGEKDRADEKTTEAFRLKAIADEQLQRAEELLYTGQLELALTAWRESRTDAALHYLHATRVDFRGWEYRYLSAIFASNQRTLLGHTNRVTWLGFHADPNLLVSACAHARANTVKVWDLRTGKTLRTWTVGTGAYFKVCMRPDAKRLVSALSQLGESGKLQLWDVETGRELLTFSGHKAQVSALCFDQEGKRLASGSKDKTVTVWQAETGQPLSTFTGHQGQVQDVCFSPDGKFLASASKDQTVRVWDLAAADVAFVLKGHSHGVASVCYSADGKYLASASEDCTVKVWAAHTGQLLHTLKGHTQVVGSVCFSADGKHLASASADQTIRVWHRETGKFLYSLKGHSGPVHHVSFSPDGQSLASGSRDKTIKIWQTRPQQEARTLNSHGNRVYSVCYSPDGNRLATAGNHRNVKVWDARTHQLLHDLEGHAKTRVNGHRVNSVCFSADGTRLASGGMDRRIILWDATAGKVERMLEGHTDQIPQVTFSPDGRLLASASSDQTVGVWDAQTGALVHMLRHPSRVQSVCFSPDGKRLASGTQCSLVKVWDVDTGEEILSLAGHSEMIWRVCYSPDGSRLASASNDGTARLWDAQTGALHLTLEGQKGSINSVCFSPDGQRLVTSGDDRTVRLWNAKTGQAILALRGHDDATWSACFSPDGSRIASASWDHTVRVWDATSHTETPSSGIPADSPLREQVEN